MRKRVLFVIGNRPLPLPFRIMKMLNDSCQYDVELLFYNRGDTPISLSLSGLSDPEKCSEISWREGNHLASKVVNRGIVLFLLAKRICAVKPDVIHAWNFDMLLAACMAAAMLRKSKVVFTLEDTTEWALSPLVKVLERWAFHKADQIFVTSQGFEFHFLRRFKLIEGDVKVVFVPNVPPARMFASFMPRTCSAELTVGYIGLFRGGEGIRTLFEAVQLARDRGADVRLLFAGKGLEQELVERLAQEHAFVDYLGPYSHDQEIVEIYKRVDMLYGVYDQSYDKKIHLAYRLCEAVNCRIPIVVAKGTHMSDVVGSYGIGVAVELGDVAGLAKELTTYCQSSDMRARIAQNCEKARPQFVFEYYQGRILKAYEALWN